MYYSANPAINDRNDNVKEVRTLEKKRHDLKIKLKKMYHNKL